MGRLHVWIPPERIGVLDFEETKGFSFRYDETWLKSPKRFALSASLKLEDRLFLREAGDFFTNLLPEAHARESLCRKMGISVDNDFELLRRIGRDCAGALVLTEEEALLPEEEGLEEIPREDLEKWLSFGSAGLLELQVEGELRLSLAGAQDKLPLVFRDGKFFRPLGSHPSTHILKPPPDRLKNLPENEWLQGRLASHLGLPTATSSLLEVGGQNLLIVERYDRLQENGRWRRLHQEDFCQALAVPARRKYESEGGPGLAECQGVLEERSADPLEDTDLLLRWQMFNVLSGNCDAHAKNLSLLRSANGEWRLAPFYDVVSTRMYPRLSAELAMKVGGQSKADTIHGKHWRKLFKSLKVSPAAYLKEVRKIFMSLPEALEKAIEDFLALTGRTEAMQVFADEFRRHHLARQKRNLSLLETEQD